MIVSSKKPVLACLCCVLGSSVAMAQTVPNHPRVNQVNQRLDNQQARINQGLANAYFTKAITLDMAISRSSNPDELQDMINRGVSSPSGGTKTPVASKR